MPNDKPDWTTATDIEAGSVNATITNASIEVSPLAGSTFDVAGSITAAISNSSLTIDGGPVTVENVASGALTVATPKTLLGTITLVASSGDLTVTPSSRAIGLSLVYQGVQSGANAHVAGVSTSAVYLPTTSLHKGGPVPLETEIDQAVDASYSVNLSNGIAGDKLFICEVTAPTIVTLGGSTVNLPSEVYAANNGLTGAAAVAVDSDAGPGFAGTRWSLAVSNRWAMPAYWQAANVIGTVNFVSVNAATQILAAAGSGKETYLHWLHLRAGTAGAQVQLVGMTSGHIYSAAQAANVGDELWETDFGWIGLAAMGGTAGEALGLKSATGSAYFVVGHLTANQS